MYNGTENEAQEKREVPIHSREESGKQFIERYTGSPIEKFQPYILLVNSKIYVENFARTYGKSIFEGLAMNASHDEQNKISIVNFGIGSPMAALIAEFLSFIKPRATILLGLCGGLREHYKIGEYFNPVAAIREEGTSQAFIPTRCPALSSFVIQRHLCEELERSGKKYYSGVIHTTNVRFWEFRNDFKQKLLEEQSQTIDMECATLFAVGFAYKIAIGALMLITDLPLEPGGVKTINSAKKVYAEHLVDHLAMGVNTLLALKAREKWGLNYQF